MTSVDSSRLDDARVGDLEEGESGRPHELVRARGGQCPVHWTKAVTEFPNAPGFWSVTRAEDIHTVSRDWKTYSSERDGITAVSVIFPLELVQAMFIGMDPPKHDRLKALFQAGFTPKRIADHEDEIRKIVINVLDRLEGRDSCELVNEVAQPVVSRVIGSFMGIPEEDDAVWARLMNSALGAGDRTYDQAGAAAIVERDVPEIFERCGKLI